MISWTTIYHEYDEAQQDPEGMRSFVTLYLGKPFKETGSRPKLDKVIELRGGYRADTVPDGVLFLTAGIDVQRGSKSDPNRPPRLEMEVCGHGRGFRTWSICYKIFTGDIGDPYEGAWEKLRTFAGEGGFLFRRDDGRQFAVMLILIDSGDGEYTDIIYRFASGWDNTYASKGFGNIKRKKGEEGDAMTRDNFKRYRMAKIGTDVLLVEIATNYYKRHLYNNLKIERRSELSIQKPGFCDFPMDYGQRYFEQLTAAEMMRDGSFNSGRRQDEALDCRVMCQCGGDMYLDQVVSDRRAAAKNMGYSPEQIQVITHKNVLEKMELETARRVAKNET
jgi:phage terminase large subunit GpA-like protein